MVMQPGTWIVDVVTQGLGRFVGGCCGGVLQAAAVPTSIRFVPCHRRLGCAHRAKGENHSEIGSWSVTGY
jgi:hypothetical protein